jgi:group I intron endonuclease
MVLNNGINHQKNINTFIGGTYIMIIYMSTNKIDGKCYIGQTKRTLNKRKQEHKREKDNCHFHNALNKYGWNNFEWKILCECESKEELDEMEFHYIKQYNSYDNGYNMTWGGDGGPIMFGKDNPMWGKKRPEISKMMKKNNPTLKESVRKKIRDSKKGKPNIKLSETIKRMGKKWHLLDPEIQKKAAEGKKGKKRPEISKMMMGDGNHFFGKTHTEESKKKMSETRLRTTGKKWIVTSPDGEISQIKNLARFCRENKLTASCMGDVAKGKRKYHKNWKCQYFE